MRPSKFLLKVLFFWLLLGVVVALLQFNKNQFFIFSEMLFWGYFCVLLSLLLLDYLSIKKPPKLIVTRDIPSSMALGVKQTIIIKLINQSHHTHKITLTDMPSAHAKIENLPQSFSIRPEQFVELQYDIIPMQRGLLEFLQVCCQIKSRWQLWEKNFNYGELESVKIYPNYKPLFASSFVNSEHLFYDMGIKVGQQRGEGTDFHQLREFRKSDSLRQIDWRATARFHKPISREYQQEQDQQVIFMLDCGRRMRAKDEEISHFDHSLNAMLISAFIALRQGDGVGLMTFAAKPLWLSAQKGMQQIGRLLDQVYDVHSTTSISDFIEASQQLLKRQTKRSLIIILSSLEPEDKEELQKAVALLSPYHIVIVASMKPQSIENALLSEITTIESALSYLGASSYDIKRATVLSQLRSEHVFVIDTKPSQLHVSLISEYLALKRSGLF